MIIDHEKVIDLIVNWLRNYAATNGRSSFIVGLNGDIGSALVALFCKKTNIKTECINIDTDYIEEDCEALKGFANKSHLGLTRINFKESYKELNNYIITEENRNEYRDDYHYYTGDKANPTVYFNEDKARKGLATCSVLPVLSTVATGFNGLIVGSRSKNDLLYRTYNKYGAGNADIFPLADLYKSEIVELFEYTTAPLCYGATYILDKEKNKIFNDITDLEVEWADGENTRTQIIVSDDSPDKHRDWQRFTLRQRQIVAKLHQLEKLTRHKINNNLQFCKVRNIDGLVR
jgi:NH3-dependent NAD+ synthetase